MDPLEKITAFNKNHEAIPIKIYSIFSTVSIKFLVYLLDTLFGMFNLTGKISRRIKVLNVFIRNPKLKYFGRFYGVKKHLDKK